MFVQPLFLRQVANLRRMMCPLRLGRAELRRESDRSRTTSESGGEHALISGSAGFANPVHAIAR